MASSTRASAPVSVLSLIHIYAFDETIQDVLIRYKRMDGYSTLWLPGYDHAGIATQIKVCLLYTSRCV